MLWAVAWRVFTRGRPIDLPPAARVAPSPTAILADRRFWLLAVLAAATAGPYLCVLLGLAGAGGGAVMAMRRRPPP